jgi:hypothetical protein
MNHYSVYELCILRDSREEHTESALGPFMRTRPIYINQPEHELDLTAWVRQVATSIAVVIVKHCHDCFTHSTSMAIIHEPNDCDGTAEYYVSDDYVVINADTGTIADFIAQNKHVIWRVGTGKYWCRYYISLAPCECKGSDYDMDEIHDYIDDRLD